MNRLDLMHTGARADLPSSVIGTDKPRKIRRSRLIAPVTSFYLAIAGFMGCGAAVIATAGLIAIHIQ